MSLLLDESVPRRLRAALPSHSVRTVIEMGWGGVKNGKLLTLAASEFDVFITVDQNLPYQQNTTALPVAVAILISRSNELEALLPLVPKLEAALSKLLPNSLVEVSL